MTPNPYPVLGDPMQSVRTAGRITTTLLIASIPVGVVTALVPAEVPFDDALTGGGSLWVPGLLLVFAELLLLVATAAAFITWLYLSSRLALAWAPPGDYWSSGWTIGAWFIPIANLVLVPLVVASTVRAAEAGSYSREGGNRVWAWWVTFVVAGCCANASYRSSSTSLQIHPLISEAVYAVAAVLAIMLIRHLTDTLEVRQRDLQRQPG